MGPGGHGPRPCWSNQGLAHVHVTTTRRVLPTFPTCSRTQDGFTQLNSPKSSECSVGSPTGWARLPRHPAHASQVLAARRSRFPYPNRDRAPVPEAGPSAEGGPRRSGNRCAFHSGRPALEIRPISPPVTHRGVRCGRVGPRLGWPPSAAVDTAAASRRSPQR